jgi:hypothetical protein
MPTYPSKYKRSIEVILHPDTAFVRVQDEADQRYPFNMFTFRKWEREGKVRFFGTPAAINCKEFERDLKNDLPAQSLRPKPPPARKSHP